MSESGYQILDLDNPSKEPDDIELVEEEVVEEAPPPEPAKPAPQSAVDEDADEEEAQQPTEGPRKISRSARLKKQRDELAAELAETKRRLEEVQGRVGQSESEAAEAASIGMDFYVRNIEAEMRSVRADYNKAFDDGDREKILDCTEKMATLAVQKQEAERNRRAVPPKAAPQSGKAPTPSTTTAHSPGASPQPQRRIPSADAWAEKNKDWFKVDNVVTAAAFAIDQEMAKEGYDPEDPEYFSELDKRLASSFPHKFGKKETPRAPVATTIQNRGGGNIGTSSNGKVRVVITQADKDFARSMGLDINEYARQKLRRERAQESVNQYTEIE